MDFCIRWRTSLLFGSNNLCSTVSSSHDQSPRTSIIMLCCSTVHPLHCCFSSHLNGPYFKVFSSSFRARLSIHGQLISSVSTCLDLWLLISGRRLYWFSLPGSLHTRERPRILVLRYSRIQASASPGNTRVAPIASNLVVAQKTESSRPHYVSKDIYSAPEHDSQSRREGHSLETYRTICKELHFPG